MTREAWEAERNRVAAELGRLAAAVAALGLSPMFRQRENLPLREAERLDAAADNLKQWRYV